MTIKRLSQITTATFVMIIGFLIVAPTVQAYTYTTLDDPNATGGTFAYGINNNGLIVGDFQDATGTHGFVYNGSTYTTIDAPNSTNQTVATGINDSGLITGYFYNSRTGSHGFVYNGSIYTTFDAPGSTASNGGTVAFSINNSGLITGLFYDGANNSHGFVYNGSTYTIFDYPGKISGTAIRDINNNGLMVGNWYSNSFMYNGSQRSPDAAQRSPGIDAAKPRTALTLHAGHIQTQKSPMA